MRRNLAILCLAMAPLAALACVSETEKPKQTANAESFELSALPADVQKAEVKFDNKITLLGYKTSQTTVKPGQKVTYTLYWQVDQPLASKGWGVFTHVLDGKKKRLLNIDRVGALREAGLSPNDWKQGKIYKDEQSFSVPKGAGGDKIQVSVGIWKGEERLPITAGNQLGDNRALAVSFKLQGGEKPSANLPSLRIDRLAAGTLLKIDGKLDEEAWKTAPSTGAFVDVRTGKPAPESPIQGTARLLWDKEALYLGFEVQDKNIVGGFAKTDVDPHLWTKDTVEIMIDPDGDGDNKDYYEIQVNPQNLVFDSQFDAYNLPKGGDNGPFGHQDWSAKLTSAVVVDGTIDNPGDTDKGYTVEVKLPWSSLSKAKKTPPDVGAEWRLNLYAMQDNGGVAWSPILGQGNFHRAPRFGRLLFAEKGWVAPVPSSSATPTVNVNTVQSAAPFGGAPKPGFPTQPVAPQGAAPGAVAPQPATPGAAQPGAPQVAAPKPPAPPVVPAPNAPAKPSAP